MRHVGYAITWMFAAGWLVACGSSGTSDPAQEGEDGGDVIDDGEVPGPDGGADLGRPDSTAPDAGDAGATDAEAGDAIPPNGDPCTWPRDCPFGDCVEGACVNDRPRRCVGGDDALCPEGEVCGGFDESYYCMRPCEQDQTCRGRSRPCFEHPNCPYGMSCHDGRCINSCETDADCGAEGYCLDGQCLPYPALWTGDAPEPLGEPGVLYAGVATLPLDYPVGVEMAGFGARAGPITPYTAALGGSDRFFEMQDVRVIALSDSRDVLIMLRLPLSWSTDFILSKVAHKLQALTVDEAHPNGIDYHDHIITGSTHSHSQPARFWDIVPHTGFGVFGHGQYSTEILERLTDSMAGTIKLALDRMAPARFGYTVLDGFDPNRRIHSDRRGESPQFLDDRLMVWRVDDADGQPIAGVVSLSLHGTHMEETWVTGDVGGAVEVVATQRLSALAGREVPVMFLNGNAGDVSPRGDDGVDVPWGKMQTVGHRVWPIFRDAFQAIATRADVELEVVTRRVPVSYDDIGYDRGRREFRPADRERPLYLGAFQCGAESRYADEASYEDGTYPCRIIIEDFFGAPVPQFMKATLSAFRIDDLVVATLPGESTSKLGAELADAIDADAEAAGFPEYTVINLGYSQDHHLYLLTPEDWLRGGYEGAQNVWGWGFGNYLSRSARELASQLFTEERESNDNGIKPSWYEHPDDTVPPTESATPVGEVLGAIAAQPRGALFEVRWTGGHPGVDLPYASLERRGEGGDFAPAERGGGLVYDNSGFDTLTIYEGDYEAVHTWAIRWELPFDLPLGDYRVRLVGRAFDGTAAEPYDVTTGPFEVQPAELQLREVSGAGGEVSVKVNYPDGPVGPDEDGALVPTGHVLRIDPERGFPDPLKRWSFVMGYALPPGQPVTLRLLDGPAPFQQALVPVEDTVTRDLPGQPGNPVGGWPTSRVAVSAPAGSYRVEITDAFGNVGTAAVEIAP